MKKLYCLLFILIITKDLISQVSPVAVEAVEIPGSGFRFIDKKTHLSANDLVWDETESFVNGFAKVVSHHRWGFVDRLGNPAINAAYQSVRNFSNKLAAVQQNNKWGFINEKGTTIIPFEYDIVYDFTELVTAVYKNDKWFLIDPKGNTIKPLDIDIFWGFKNGSAKITRQGRSGTMNTKGMIISIEPEKISLKKNNTTTLRTNSSQSGVCPDNIGFENGNFTNWSCFIGDVAAVSGNNVITVNPSPPTVNRHVIYPRSTPSAIDPFGLFPTNPPDGSGYALKLGNDVNGAEAERVTYPINVPANSSDASITYRYAVVFQDPGHLTYEQPRFSAKVLDVLTNTYLPCASYEYVSTSSLPGFNISPVDDSVKYKNWASVFINLSAYAGRTLLLEFTTADCTKGGHWGYAYVDVGDCDIAASVQYQCSPSMATFAAPPGFEFYNWWNDDFTVLLGTGQNFVLSPAPVISSSVHVEVIPFNGFGCSDTLDVALSPTLPVANAGPDQSICPGTSARIGSAAVTGLTYAWTPSTFLTPANSSAPYANPPVATQYVLTVTNAASGCTAVDTVNITVNTKPIAAFNPGPAQCLAGNNFTFTNTSTGGSSYAWSFGDGGSSAQTNPMHSYASAGTYVVKLVVTGSNGCKDSITNPAVTVNSNPVVRTNNDLSICRGNSVQLQTTGAQTYTWTPVLNLSCTNCANPIASPLTNTSYIVRGTDSYGCPGYDTVAITVYQPIQITVSPDRTICQQESVNLLVSGSAASYIWSPAQSLSSTVIANPVASPLSTIQYMVVGYDGHNCFTDTGFIRITVNPKPAVELGPDLTLSTGTVYPLTPVTQNGPIISWQWTPATNLSCNNCPDPSATVKKDITYHVLVSNEYSCTAVDSIKIKTFCEGSQVYIPNAFTPDGDGKNDILMVRAKGIESVRSLRIFSRWGELIFEKLNFPPNSPAYGWDGKIKGTPGPAEVYVYTAEVICDNLQTYTFKGNISILK
jgi:gliding motility-associated-like protein